MGLKVLPSVRKWLVLPPVLLGIAIFAWLMFRAPGPERKPPQEAMRVLRVIEAPQVDVVPRVLGYGSAKPARVWRAVAEVEGRAVEVHSELKSGSFLKAGEVVVKIDPREYELAVSQLDSEITEIKAQCTELDTREENDRASLQIEEASLQIAEAELNRVRELIERDAAAQTEVRDEERTYLAQKQKVQGLQNSLNLAPRQRATLRASLAVKGARLEQSQLDLAKTVIRVPFNCRLGEVQIETGQYLKTGEGLFEADGLEATEIDVQISIDRLADLLHARAGHELGGVPDMDTLREQFNIEATARMRIGDFATDWPARFVRVREEIDPITRTVALVVAVDRPYANAIPGKRPPLVRGMFCEVELRGAPLLKRVVIPRVALHNDRLYVVDADNRLQLRPVKILFTQSDFLCVDSGIQAGERIVVSDPTPAIEGMLVEPVADESLADAVIAQATKGAGG